MAGFYSPLRSAVGTATAGKLADGLDLHTVGDLLRHYPRRYEQRGRLTPLQSLAVGREVTVLAEIESVQVRRMRHRPGQVVEVRVTDGSAWLTLTFFNQRWLPQRLAPGMQALFAGRVRQFGRTRQLTHPEYQLLDGDGDGAGFAEGLIPIYPAVRGLPSWRIEKAVQAALGVLDPPEDPIPARIRDRHQLLGLPDALTAVHRPGGWADVRRGRQRFKWEEALSLQVLLARRRAADRVEPAVPRPARDDRLLAAFDAGLPYRLTAGQQQVSQTLLADLAGRHPMRRLLQGDVGSGKTVVAVRAMLAVVDAGGQAALLAPTEVLAQQHARSIRALMGPLAAAGELGGADLATRVALLTGSLTGTARRQVLAEIADGTAGVVVGTHALLEEGVRFADLGLVVVDEQHRFGVEQRDTLRGRASAPPHLLVMTATPIPRTVAMTVYGDLEVSTLTELPPGRAPVPTTVVAVADRPHWWDRVWQRLREEAAAGRQAYVVCPRIGGDEAEDDTGGPLLEEDERRATGVLETLPKLSAGPLAGLRLAELHGRLPPDEKDRTMRRFAAGELDVLVSTTVIEVGVDVPNATMMVVLDADRFGVSQLHQLRGRVGRGEQPGLCLLVTETPAGSPGRVRLDAVAATPDGFQLARLDLQQRREGDVLGVAQHGRRSSLRMLELLVDEELIGDARAEAFALVDADPQLTGEPALAGAVDALIDPERAEYLQKA